MIGYPPRHTAFCAIATLGFVASDLAAGAAGGRPDGASLSFSPPTVTLAARCDPRFPVATVHVTARNGGSAPTSPANVTVLDTAHELAGSAALPQLAAQASHSIDVPLSLDPGFDESRNPAVIAGDHTFGVYLSDPQSPHTRLTSSVANVSTTIPAAFCVQSTTLRSPKSSSTTKAPEPSLATTRTLLGSQAQTLFGSTSPLAASVVPSVNVVPSAVPSDNVRATATLRADNVPAVVTAPTPPLSAGVKRNPVALLVAVPQGLRAATNAGDCEAHLHAYSPIGGVASCQSMISSGNLVLIWDAPADASVDGYRLYALAGGERGPAVATVSGEARTLANLPPIASGPVPQCYVVTATRGSNESLAGPAYCAREATLTKTLGTTYTRGAWQDRSHYGALSGFGADDNVPDGPVVGYYDAAKKSVLGDSSYDKIRRYAVAFDVDPLRNKRLVSARLHFTVQLSYGAGNNHSCATTVASGIEFWWKPDAASWIDGSFSSSPAKLNDTGPVVTADVTKQVAAIMAGSPNYGFVMRNDSENLDAFMNAQCETVYGNPQLEIVYYDR